MINAIKSLFLSLGMALFAVAALAQVGTLPNWPPHKPASAPVSFTGLGDVHAAAVYASCTFAYSSATRGTKACKLCNGGVCADVNSDASTGIVPNAPTINGAPCNNTTHKCTIDVLYDKGTIGSDYALNPSFNDTNRPVFVVDGYASGVPCASYTAANTQQLGTTSSGASTGAYIVSAVAKRTSDPGTAAVIWFASGPQMQINTNPPVSVNIYAGGSTPMGVALSDNTWGAMAGLYNGTSSYLNVNGTTNSSGVDVGSAAITGTQVLGGFVYGGSSYNYEGMICEFAWVDNTSTTSVADNIVANQRSRYGF